MTNRITDAELSEMLVDAGRHHHTAFIDSDGVDPEWPQFYAAYIQTQLWDGLGVVPTKSELIFILLGAEEAIRKGAETGAWPDVYARWIRVFANEKSAR